MIKRNQNLRVESDRSAWNAFSFSYLLSGFFFFQIDTAAGLLYIYIYMHTTIHKWLDKNLMEQVQSTNRNNKLFRRDPYGWWITLYVCKWLNSNHIISNNVIYVTKLSPYAVNIFNFFLISSSFRLRRSKIFIYFSSSSTSTTPILLILSSNTCLWV